MTADDVVVSARSAIGIPFRHQGRSVTGLDCAGLIVWVAQELGIEHHDSAGYGRRPSGGLLEAALDSQPGLARVTNKNDLQRGDVLLMRFSGDPQHLGVFAGETMIHAYSTVGQVCEHRFSGVWKARVVRVYRFTGIES